MIAELWDYITTSAKPEARSEGYLYHSIALAHRARRCRQHWESHLHHCWAALATLPEDDSCAVVGSGLLMETPLETLLAKYAKVELFDVVHSKQVRSEISKNPERHRIRLHELDLNKTSLFETQNLLKGFDSVISANVLSQLPYVISANMRKSKATDEQIAKCSFELQKKHCDLFRSLGERGTLFSDFQMHFRDLQGRVFKKMATVDKGISVRWKSPWMWDLAPTPELSPEYSVSLKMGIASWD